MFCKVFFNTNSNRRGGVGADTETQTWELTGREGGGEEYRGQLQMTERRMQTTIIRVQQP